jgi:hypothetical protein
VSDRTAWGRFRTILALLTIATLLAMPLSAFGAKGKGLEASLTTLTKQASVGNLLAFAVSFTNSGKSAIQQFRFDGRVLPATSASFSAANFVSGGTAPCSAGTSSNEVMCVFGSLPAGAPVDLLLLFTADAVGQARFSGEFSGDARTGTPGQKQDRWDAIEQVGDGQFEIFAAGDFYGGWVTDGGPQTFPTIGATTQKTTVSIPGRAGGYAVAIGHSDTTIQCGSETYTGYGLTVEMSVAGGNSPVTVTIEHRQSGLNANTVKFVHQGDDGLPCTFPPKVAGCLESEFEECYDARTVGSGNNQRVVVEVKLKGNGRAKNF